MDMHTHLTMQFGPTIYLDRFRNEAADISFKSVVFAKRTLDAGFTTVRDLGDSHNITVSLRNAINSGLIDGPRIFTAAKSIATTGGHADPTNGMSSSLQPEATPKNGVIDGPSEAIKAVRQRYKDGADLIKITATGGVLSVAKNGQNPQFNQEELEAIIATANDYDMHVAAHAHGAEGMKRALRAGVKTIEHGTYMDEDVINLLKKFDAYYVPTIIAGKWVAEKSKIDGYFPEVVRPKAATIGPIIQETFGRANKAGVNIAFGTDSGVSEHGRNAEEFVYMVEAGMTPIQALKSATVNTAELLGVSETLGTLEVDKLADIIAVKGNPLDDITKLQRIEFIMKDGKLYKKPLVN
jgi:imidazolonepropionase-like amidohydrolase